MTLLREQRDEAHELEAALSALSNTGEWVRFSDGKTAILAASVTALLVGWISVAKAAALATPVELRCAQMALVLIGVGLCVAALLYAAWSLRARVEHVGPPNVFSWPYLASTGVEVEHSRRNLIGQAWSQAEQLARVARQKYHEFNVALTFALAGLLLLAISLIPYVLGQ